MIDELPATTKDYWEGKKMPWTAKQFKKKHNKALTDAEAEKAAEQASAIVEKGGDEGMAIAVANKHAKKLRTMGHKKTLRKPKERQAG